MPRDLISGRDVLSVLIVSHTSRYDQTVIVGDMLDIYLHN